MKGKILIVEDEFIEANDLRSILENAGYQVCGIARAVLQAIQMMEKVLPDMVLVDIFLSGTLTGIDLAEILVKKEIPFIYLSANSNQSTLEEAKSTQPYGFLVKPFREKDILVTLEIAAYRHALNQDVRIRQVIWLKGLLENIVNKDADAADRLVLLAKSLQPLVDFDYMLVDSDSGGLDFGAISCLERVDYDDYRLIDFFSSEQPDVLSAGLAQARLSISGDSVVSSFGKADLSKSFGYNRVNSQLGKLYNAQSGLVISIKIDRKVSGAITFYNLQEQCFTSEHVKLLEPLLPVFGALISKIKQPKFRNEPSKIPNAVTATEAPRGFHGIIGRSPQLLKTLDQLVQVASYDTAVLVTGETGAGKEGIVNALHQLSPRKSMPLIKVNCAAIPESIVESELFGHEKGAFTGADERRIGKFEQAQGGTLFLDEISEISLDMQSKLLRVIQEKEMERLGGRSTIAVDVRIVVATNKNLYREVALGNFRMDLYYRINIFPIHVPPLRERKDDIPLLIEHFLLLQSEKMDSDIKKITPQVLQQLVGYSWPGNIRQLQHLIERSVILNKGETISSVDLPPDAVELPPPALDFSGPQSIEEVKRTHIIEVITQCNGRLSGEGGAAEILQVSVNSLRLDMRKLGIVWPHPSHE